MTENIYNRTV